MRRAVRRTQAGGEECDVKVCHELLGVGIEHALLGGNITGQADADDLQHRFEDEQHEMKERGVVGLRADRDHVTTVGELRGEGIGVEGPGPFKDGHRGDGEARQRRSPGPQEIGTREVNEGR